MKIIGKMGEKLKGLARKLGVDDPAEALFFPKYFEVETVNICNASCKMCTVKDWKKRKNYLMSKRNWYKFLNEIKDYSEWIERVNVSRDGEPLLDPDLEEKVKDLKKIDIRYVTFATNGSLLTGERAKSLLDSGLDDIMFSIDGATKETYERIRIGLKFEKVVKNCIDFIAMRDKGGYKTTIRVRMVLQHENMAELDDWSRFWKPLLRRDDRIYAKPAHNWGNQLSGHKSILSKAKMRRYSNELCISPWSTVVVKVNGDIPLCPVDFRRKFFMGNIKRSSIKKIWNSKGFETVRQKMAEGKRDDLALCKDCYLWDRATVIEA